MDHEESNPLPARLLGRHFHGADRAGGDGMSVDIEKLKALAEAAKEDWCNWYTMQQLEVRAIDGACAELIAAANPAAVLELIAEVERGHRRLIAACTSLGDIGEALGADMDDDTDHLIGMIKHLREERDQLKAENEALRKELEPFRNPDPILIQGLDEVIAEQSRIEQDAEWYRWFRGQHWDSSAICAVTFPKEATKLGAYCPSGDLLDQMVLIVIEGDPRGKGRPRFTVRGKGKQQFVQVYTDPETVAYEELIQEEVLRHMGGQALVDNTRRIKRRTFIEAYKDFGGQPIFTGPVLVEMEIYHPIRASWTKAKKAAALASHIAPTLKPDPDNVAKIWFDAFNDCMWKDDTQVIKVSIERSFSEEPSVLVRVIPLDLLPA